jgi:hypothetical protein
MTAWFLKHQSYFMHLSSLLTWNISRPYKAIHWYIILPHVWVTRDDGFWIEGQIYRTFQHSVWQHNSLSLSQAHTHTHLHTSVHSHVFTNCCLVAASNSQHSPSSGFPNCPQPQLQQLLTDWLTDWLWLTLSLTNQLNSFQFNWLSQTVLLITSQQRLHKKKHHSSVAVFRPLTSNGPYIFVCFMVIA